MQCYIHWRGNTSVTNTVPIFSRSSWDESGRGARVDGLEGGGGSNLRDSQQGQTFGQCISWLCLAGSQETRGNVRKTHRRAAGGKEYHLGAFPQDCERPLAAGLRAPHCPQLGPGPPRPGTWRCGQAASRVGSSSSGSNSAPVGFDEGGSVRKRFTEN